MSQLHKRFTSDEVKELLQRYLKHEIERNYIQEILGIKKRRFFTSSSSIKNILKVSLSSIKDTPITNFFRDRTQYPEGVDDWKGIIETKRFL